MGLFFEYTARLSFYLFFGTKEFSENGYTFHPELSTAHDWVFCKKLYFKKMGGVIIASAIPTWYLSR